MNYDQHALLRHVDERGIGGIYVDGRWIDVEHIRRYAPLAARALRVLTNGPRR